MNINYKIDSASERDINNHLNRCDGDFIPKLSSRVNINDFSKKIAEKTTTFEAWNGQILAGMLSAYFNNPEIKTGYINNISVIREYVGNGIASKLLDMCIDYAKEYSFKEVRLEVFKDNIRAIELYKKFGFRIFKNNNDFMIMRYEMSSL